MIIAVSMLLGATSGNLSQYMTMAGALLLTISGSLHQCTTMAISLLRLRIPLMDLTLDYLIPIIHAPISLEPYMART